MNTATLPDDVAARLLAQWLPADESRTLEFKRVSGKMVGKALETVCAFANANGGLLVLGLADLKEHKGPAKGESGHLVVVAVARSPQVHSLVAGGTYTRMERGNRELSAAEIIELSYRRGTRSAADEAVPVALDRLDTQAWQRFLQRRGPLSGSFS